MDGTQGDLLSCHGNVLCVADSSVDRDGDRDFDWVRPETRLPSTRESGESVLGTITVSNYVIARRTRSN